MAQRPGFGGFLRNAVPIVAAGTIVVAVLARWLTSTPESLLRDELRRWQFWILEAQFLIVVALSSLNIWPFLRSLRLHRRDYVAPAAISFLALVLVTRVAPQTNRIYYDEQIYQSIGQNLADLHLAQMCNDGTVEYGTLQCWRGEYNKEPYGYPYLLSLAYRLAGVRESVAFGLNVLVTVVLVWIVFFLATALTERVQAGRYAALIIALMPELLRWSHTTAAEPAATMMSAFAVLTAVAFVRLRTTRALLWMATAGVFATQFRPECILVVPVAIAMVMIFTADELARPRLWWTAVLALALVGVHLGHLVAVRGEGWGTTGPRMSLTFFRGNLATNGGLFLVDRRFPVAYTLLAVVGLWFWRRRATLVVIAYFGAFWGIFLFFYAGSYNYGADDRFSLMMLPPVAVLAGAGLAFVIDALTHRQAWVRWGEAVAVSALLFQFSWYVPFVRAIGEEAWGARADVAFAKSAASELPPNSLILTHNPNMFHVWGYNAAQASLVTTDVNYLTDVIKTRYAGGVYLHWNFWCNVADPVQQSFCADALNRFPHTLVREYRERDYRYAIYRLALPDNRPDK